MTVLLTQMDGSSTNSMCKDEDIFITTMGLERPGHVRTFGLGPSIKDVFGGGFRQSQEQSNMFQAQLQEQFQVYRVQLETQMKEMMEAQMEVLRTQMEATIQAQATIIQAQQTRMEHLDSQVGTRGGPAAVEAAIYDHFNFNRFKMLLVPIKVQLGFTIQCHSHNKTCTSFCPHRVAKRFTRQRQRTNARA